MGFFNREQYRKDNIMKRRKGFTLIELLVVIAIISLLMSILMPALSKVRQKAKDVLCKARLSDWAKIFEMYTGQNDGFWHNGPCPP